MAVMSKTQFMLNESYLEQDQIKQLQDAGLTDIQIVNMVKKQLPWEKMLKQVKGKVENNEARAYLKQRFGTDADGNKLKAADIKVPERRLPVLSKKELKDWTITNQNQQLNIIFPLLPSVNHMYQTGPTGGKMMTDPAKVLFVECQDLVELEMKIQNWQPLYKTKVVADLWFYYPDNLRRDSHNMFKFLFDTMDGIMIDDDRWILPRVQNIIVDPDTKPRIEVKIYLKDVEPITFTPTYMPSKSNTVVVTPRLGKPIFKSTT